MCFKTIFYHVKFLNIKEQYMYITKMLPVLCMNVKCDITMREEHVLQDFNSKC